MTRRLADLLSKFGGVETDEYTEVDAQRIVLKFENQERFQIAVIDAAYYLGSLEEQYCGNTEEIWLSKNARGLKIELGWLEDEGNSPTYVY